MQSPSDSLFFRIGMRTATLLAGVALLPLVVDAVALTGGLEASAASEALAGMELHAENEAQAVTPLYRRDKKSGVRHHHQHEEGTAVTGVHASISRGTNLTTPLEDMTSEYIGHIGVGTNKDGISQFNARVVFDTGSTNLWVASVLCQTFPCTGDRAREFYNPQESSTSEEFVRPGRSGKDIDIIFGTGELRGPLHVDTYRVGPMVVRKQPFAMIREMTGSVFSSFPFEGILGLGFRSLSFGGIEPFFERVIDQKLLKSNEFAFFLNANPAQPSAILWGGVDKNLYDGPIRMFPVVQAHYWALELLDFRIGNKSLGISKSGKRRVKRLIVDSGTTYFTAPSALYPHIAKRLQSTTCGQVERESAQYAPLVFVLQSASGKKFELEVTEETYMLGDGVQGDGEANDVGRCRPAFMRLDVAPKYGPAMILGEVFMRSFFTVFSRGTGDVSEAKVGFARAKVGALPKGAREMAELQPAELAAAADSLTEESERLAPVNPAHPPVRRRTGKPGRGLMRRESEDAEHASM